MSHISHRVRPALLVKVQAAQFHSVVATTTGGDRGRGAAAAGAGATTAWGAGGRTAAAAEPGNADGQDAADGIEGAAGADAGAATAVATTGRTNEGGGDCSSGAGMRISVNFSMASDAFAGATSAEAAAAAALLGVRGEVCISSSAPSTGWSC